MRRAMRKTSPVSSSCFVCTRCVAAYPNKKRQSFVIVVVIVARSRTKRALCSRFTTLIGGGGVSGSSDTVYIYVRTLRMCVLCRMCVRAQVQAAPDADVKRALTHMRPTLFERAYSREKKAAKLHTQTHPHCHSTAGSSSCVYTTCASVCASTRIRLPNKTHTHTYRQQQQTPSSEHASKHSSGTR